MAEGHHRKLRIRGGAEPLKAALLTSESLVDRLVSSGNRSQRDRYPNTKKGGMPLGAICGSGRKLYSNSAEPASDIVTITMYTGDDE